MDNGDDNVSFDKIKQKTRSPELVIYENYSYLRPDPNATECDLNPRQPHVKWHLDPYTLPS